MAKVRWGLFEFTAEPVRQLEDGCWEMIAKQHTPRTSPGTAIRVQPSEILEMAAAEMPNDDGSDRLNAAMTEERQHLPSFAEIAARNRKASK